MACVGPGQVGLAAVGSGVINQGVIKEMMVMKKCRVVCLFLVGCVARCYKNTCERLHVLHKERVMSGKLWVVMLSMFLFAVAGCTHEMHVTNLSHYLVPKTEVGSSSTFDVAITAYEDTIQDRPFFNAVVEGLKNHPQIRLMRTDWTAEKKEQGFDPVHLITVNIKPKFKGDGVNFWTTWPGCYVFACAWGGYQYHCNIDTTVTLVPISDRLKARLAASGKSAEPATKDIPTNFDFKHCDFGRGFWSGTGWWFPGFGLHNIVTGMFFTDYEKQATTPFHTAADATYGKYVANEIVKLCHDQGADLAVTKNTGN
jgi:hypothetical protein